ncbi:MAG: hypothetical protein C4522_12560 [Desulfobacteraceae bacterium]|nr:MAG: hypothetical protein C4522_12560 [Desulfobacteraceae bacterium]
MDKNTSSFQNTGITEKSLNIFFASISEFLFIVFPFVVIFIISLYISDTKPFIAKPEWAVAASILFGQSLVKWVSGIAAQKKSAVVSRVAFVVTLVIVCGLLPSIIVLTLLLITPSSPTWLNLTQIALFIIATVVFFLLGGLGNYLLDNNLAEDRTGNNKQKKKK